MRLNSIAVKRKYIRWVLWYNYDLVTTNIRVFNDGSKIVLKFE
jgi:hypothetical protein